MGTLKSTFVLALLGVVGYFLYTGLNQGFHIPFGAPPPTTPPWIADQVPPTNIPPVVSMPESHGDHPPNSPPHMPPVATDTIPNNSSPSTGAPPTQRPYDQPLTNDTPPAPGSMPPTGNVTNSSELVGLTHPPLPAANVPPTTVPRPSAPTAPPNFTEDIAETPIAATQPGPPLLTKAVPVTTGPYDAAMTAVREQLDNKQLSTALTTLSIFYENRDFTPEQHGVLVNLLDQVAGSVIYSREHLLEAAYRVKPGERLQDIADQLKIPVGLLAKVNGIAVSGPLVVGTDLKVIRGPFSAVVNTTKNEMTLWLGPSYAGRFLVTLGPEFANIVGPFVVQGKTRQDNAAGGLPWIQLGTAYRQSRPDGDGPQLRIAGTGPRGATLPAKTPGRIAVSAKDADDLYDILSKGSKVTIQR